MWELFEAYRKEVKSNPRTKHVFVGKDGASEMEERERPLTDKGFYNYCRRNIGCARQYFDNQDGLYGDYIAICRAIKDEIDEDQLDGGMTNIYNPSITQRLQGLTDKKEHKVNVTKFEFDE
jgi:hypothetical protein